MKNSDSKNQKKGGCLEAQNLQKFYKNQKILDDVSLHIKTGEIVGILGPNGAGKTTCFHMLIGLIRVDNGSIILDGKEITHSPPHQRASLGIGYLPQESSIFRGLTVEDNIRSILEIVEQNPHVISVELECLLQEFKIEHLRSLKAVALSGGERRRLEIARAVACRPTFMLLDEPFAGVDPIAISDIQNLIRQLKLRGIGMLITDHNVRETLALADRSYIIYSGKVIMQGNSEETLKNADVRKVYLGDDFMV